MARSTYFFTKKKLNEILKLYGGGYRWTLHEELSEKRQISYMDKKDVCLPSMKHMRVKMDNLPM